MKSLESPVWFAPVQFMQTKRALNFVLVEALSLSLSLASLHRRRRHHHHSSVVDKRISRCYNPQNKKKQKYSLLSNEQSRRTMVCLYLREWLPTGTRSPDPATLQCAKKHRSCDRHRSFWPDDMHIERY